MVLKLADVTGVLEGEEFQFDENKLNVDEALIDTFDIEYGLSGEPTGATLEMVSTLRVGPAGAAALDWYKSQLEEGRADEQPKMKRGGGVKKLRKLMQRLLPVLQRAEHNGEVAATGTGGYEHE